MPCAELTAVVEITKVVDAEPAAMVTLPGTAATPEFVLERATSAPPPGAEPVSVTVPTAVPPPTSAEGDVETEATPGGTTVITAVRVSPSPVAVRVTGVEEATGDVPTSKLADVRPAGTVTDPGTVATLEFALESVMTEPPSSAAPVSVTVPVEEVPPPTLDGLTLRLESTGVWPGLTFPTWSNQTRPS
jgi:hypothetical protein